MRVIVIGAGLAGLAAAHELHDRGVEVEVFEARDRVGGRIWSVPFAGAVAEAGAEFILPEEIELVAVVRRMGLTLVRKGTLYGDREPRGGERVPSAEMAAAAQRLSALSGDGTALAALSRSGTATRGDGGDSGAGGGQLCASCRGPRQPCPRFRRRGIR